MSHLRNSLPYNANPHPHPINRHTRNIVLSIHLLLAISSTQPDLGPAQPPRHSRQYDLTLHHRKLLANAAARAALKRPPRASWQVSHVGLIKPAFRAEDEGVSAPHGRVAMYQPLAGVDAEAVDPGGDAVDGDGEGVCGIGGGRGLEQAGGSGGRVQAEGF